MLQQKHRGHMPEKWRLKQVLADVFLDPQETHALLQEQKEARCFIRPWNILRSEFHSTDKSENLSVQYNRIAHLMQRCHCIYVSEFRATSLRNFQHLSCVYLSQFRRANVNSYFFDLYTFQWLWIGGLTCWNKLICLYQVLEKNLTDFEKILRIISFYFKD